MRNKAKGIADRFAQSKDLQTTVSILYNAAEIADCVEIDKEAVKRVITEELNKKTKNPFNALLGIFGLRVVNAKDPEKSFGFIAEDEFGAADLLSSKSLLKLNENFDGICEKIADSLSLMEKSVSSNSEELGNVFKQLDKKSCELNQIKTDYNTQRQEILERTQYILSITGENVEKDSVAEQVVELLADIGVTVHWSEEGTEFSERVMFNHMNVRTVESRKVKPCLVADGKVVLKGLKFYQE